MSEVPLPDDVEHRRPEDSAHPPADPPTPSPDRTPAHSPAHEPAEPASPPRPPGPTPSVGAELAGLLGGRRAALDATAPPVAFVAGWLLTDRSVPWAAGIALVVALALAAYRISRGGRPRAVIVGLLGVAVGALIAVYTGHAADFFLVQLASNAASALAWLVSIVIRWPLLGVIVGLALGQRTTWRRDPDLLRAYSRASMVWVFQYVVRVAVFSALYAADSVVALGVARVALSWPLVAACLAVSAWVLARSIPRDHPGIRHVRRPHQPAPS